MRLVIAAYWTPDDDSLEGLATYLRFVGAIPEAGSIIALSPEHANQPGLRSTLATMHLREAAFYNPDNYEPREEDARDDI